MYVPLLFRPEPLHSLLNRGDNRVRPGQRPSSNVGLHLSYDVPLCGQFGYGVTRGLCLYHACTVLCEKDAGIKYLAYNHWYSDRDLCRNKHICSKWLFTSSADPLHRM